MYCVVRYTGIEAALSIVMGHGGIDNFAQLLKENNLKNVAMVFTDGPVTPYGQVCCTVAGLARRCLVGSVADARRRMRTLKPRLRATLVTSGVHFTPEARQVCGRALGSV